MHLRFPFAMGLLATLTLSVPLLGAATDMQPLTERQKIVHVLNRLGYGPRPGDVEQVEKMGIEAYVRLQLNPETIDDSAAEKALAPLDTLKMPTSHLIDEYFGDIRRFIEEQKNSGNPEELKLRYGIDIGKAKAAEAEKKTGPRNYQELAQRDALRCVGELQDAKLIQAIVSERQLTEVLADFWENHFNVDIRKNECRVLKIADDRDAIRPHVLGKFRDLLGASAHSAAMLAYLDNNQNSVVRERGKLETAAIGMFISNKIGVDAKSLMSTREGPNENYGREILELHTLGVDGGYTQKDVQEVARCFSGWTFGPLNGNFDFTSNRHDSSEKVVLGQVIPAGGNEQDGEKVLDLLAAHPSTAKFISRKLCQRFVADEPPPELVDRVAKVFHDTDGDLRKVVESIVTSPEFFSGQAYRAKIKSPFEYVVSAVRATGGTFVAPTSVIGAKVRHVAEGAGTIGYGGDKLSAAKRKSLNWHVFDMGEPLYAFAAPTGYPEVSVKWVNPGAVIDRLNFALALTQQEVSDVRIAPEALVKGADADEPQAVFNRLAESLLHGAISESTKKTIMKNALPKEGEAKTVSIPKLTALLLGSPEFQRR